MKTLNNSRAIQALPGVQLLSVAASFEDLSSGSSIEYFTTEQVVDELVRVYCLLDDAYHKIKMLEKQNGK